MTALELVQDAFSRPACWPLLLLAPLVAFASLRAARSATNRRVRTLGPRAAAERVRAHPIVPAAAFACAALAAMQPSIGAGDRSLVRPAADVVVALDVSRSMLARDVEPDRLEAAKSEILALAARVRRSPGDRLGLVAFAGDARLVTPLTRDVESFAELLRSAGVESASRGGTDLGAAIEAAAAAIGPETGGAAIVLVTDGEDLAATGRAAAVRARARGIAVHCIGVGSEGGSKVVLEGAGGGAAEFLRDRSGREVVTMLDAAGLRAIAAAAGGEFRRFAPGERPLVDLHDSVIAPAAARAPGAESGQERANRFQWPLFVAILLWMFDIERRTRGRA